MIYTLSGKLALKKGNVVVVEAGDIGFKVTMPFAAEAKLPPIGSRVTVFTHLHIREKEGTIELYGFLSEQELNLFGALLSVSGVGPKSALGIISIAPVEQLIAAITKGEAKILQRSSGIGRKTAERIILELRGEMGVVAEDGSVSVMESDSDVYEALIELGYTRNQAKTAIQKINPNLTSVNDRLRDALRKFKP